MKWMLWTVGVLVAMSFALRAEVRVSEVHYYVVKIDGKDADGLAEAFGVNHKQRGNYEVVKTEGMRITVNHLTSVNGAGIPKVDNDVLVTLDPKEVTIQGDDLSANFSGARGEPVYLGLKGIKPRDLGGDNAQKTVKVPNFELDCVYSKQGFNPYDCNLKVTRGKP